MNKITKPTKKGLIVQIGDHTTITADAHQYILNSKYGTGFFGYLEYCFQELFEGMVKAKAIEDDRKTIGAILEIHKEVAKDLRKIYRGIECPFDE